MNKLSVRTWASIAEITSAIAVVFSLIYVGIEINRAATLSDADVYEELLVHTVRRRVLIVQNPDLAEIFVRGSIGFEELTEAEKLRYLNYQELLFVAWERARDTHVQSILRDDLWDAWNGFFAGHARKNPDFLWGEVRDTWDSTPDFQAHVDAILKYEPNE